MKIFVTLLIWYQLKQTDARDPDENWLYVMQGLWNYVVKAEEIQRPEVHLITV